MEKTRKPKMNKKLVVPLFFLLIAGFFYGSNTCAQDYSSERLQTIAKDLIQLRLVGVKEPSYINKFFAPVGKAPVYIGGSSFEVDYEKALWQLFFKQSQAYLGHGNSKQPIVGYYNPFSDYWLLTSWNYTGKEPKLEKTILYPGSFLRDHKRKKSGLLQSGVDWKRALDNASKENPLSLRKSLQIFTAQAVGGFYKNFPEFSITDGALPQLTTNNRLVRSVFFNRMAAIYNDNANLVFNEKLNPLYERYISYLLNKKWVELDGMAGKGNHLERKVFDELEKVPSILLENLEPFLVLKLNNDIVVLSGQATNGRFVFLSVFSESENKPILKAISGYDLYAMVHE